MKLRNVLALSLIVLGCGVPDKAPVDSTRAQDRAAGRQLNENYLTLVVENRTSQDVKLYNWAGYRLGLSLSDKPETIKIQRDAVFNDQFEIQLQPLGSNQKYSLEPVPVFPGDTVQLTIVNGWTLSTLTVYNREN